MAAGDNQQADVAQLTDELLTWSLPLQIKNPVAGMEVHLFPYPRWPVEIDDIYVKTEDAGGGSTAKLLVTVNNETPGVFFEKINSEGVFDGNIEAANGQWNGYTAEDNETASEKNTAAIGESIKLTVVSVTGTPTALIVDITIARQRNV